MIKTVSFEFPDDFRFPKQYGDNDSCNVCMFGGMPDCERLFCTLKPDEWNTVQKCPFYHGQESFGPVCAVDKP